MGIFKYILFVLCLICISSYSFAIDPQQDEKISQYNLGVKYYNGENVPRDYQKAFRLFKKSAEQGLSQAQYNLAVMYRNATGVPGDASKAVEWFTKAANQEDADAQLELGYMYLTGEGVVKSRTKAKEYFKKACLNKIRRGCLFYNTLTD